jgi:class 3 adenylate cyclase
MLFGWDEGAVRAVLCAAMHPNRVAGLILYACYAKASASDDYTYANPPEIMDALVVTAEELWGRGEWGWQLAAPSAGFDPELRRYFARMQRMMSGPGDAIGMVRLTAAMDIRRVLPSVRTPTLVLHRIEDGLVPVSQSRFVASQIPNAKLVELPGNDNVIWLGDTGAVLDEVEQFVTGAKAAPSSARALTTVVLTDIVRSTERAAELGDARWRHVVAEHDRTAAAIIRRLGGRVVKSTGDGLLATFDGPARATRAATELAHAVGPLGIEIRAGIHTGEVELTPNDVLGLAVHIVARIAAEARPGEVLVSSTVKDLVVGSGLQFADRGNDTLRGVPELWRLYGVRDEA